MSHLAKNPNTVSASLGLFSHKDSATSAINCRLSLPFSFLLADFISCLQLGEIDIAFTKAWAHRFNFWWQG